MEKLWGEKMSSDTGSSDTDEEKDIIKTEAIGNHLYFYAKVNRKNVWRLNRSLHRMDIRLQKLQVTYSMVESVPIILHISSSGGYVAPALAAMDTIRDLVSPVHTIVEGECCSGATFLSLVGKKRYIRKHAYMMIHQIQSGFWGKYKELKDEVANLDMLMATVKDIYKEYTKIPEKLIEQILERDLYLKSTLCLKHGMVDEIINY